LGRLDGLQLVKHHDDAIARYVAREAAHPDTLAVIVSGSLARGTERDTSDIDLYLLVSEERWLRAMDDRRLMYTEREGIGYEGGYFDVKLATLSYLADAAERGDDPVRDSFVSSRIAFSRVDDLAERIASVGVVPESSWDARVASFLAQARLHGGYFLRQAYESGDALLLSHASVHLATSAARAMLAVNHTLFSGPKYLAATLASLGSKPAGFDALLSALLATPTPATADAVLESLEAFVGATLPSDETLSTFILDNELAWRYRSKTPEYS
jgi:predicted nucleotidyltransferase